MPSDQLVDARSILEAIGELKRRGHDAVLRELESIEQDLASHILEELTAIHHTLTDSGARPKLVRRVHRQAEAVVLVAILAMRKAHYRLWQENNPLVEEEPASPTDPPSGS